MEDTLQGKTLDESADKLGISHSTAWSWRHKIMEKMKSFQEGIMLSDRSELDEKYFHKSHKGKKLSDAEPKKRGTPARKRGEAESSSAPLPAYPGMERPLPRYTTWGSLRRMTWRT